MKRVNVCVLRTAGTNCDKETAFAFQEAGAEVELVHVNRLVNQENNLHDYQVLAFPGGFSYGDDIASGKIFANELKYKLVDELKRFIAEGKLIIGICNGFQILVKSGLLPGGPELKQTASLIINDSAKFEDRWVYLRSQGKCVWTKGLPEKIYLPVAHGEGKFVADRSVLNSLKKSGQVVFKYCDEEGNTDCEYPQNPNGSLDSIAGICDETGRIFGLMPHPERHISFSQHPRWNHKMNKEGDGLTIFRNGVEYVQKNL